MKFNENVGTGVNSYMFRQSLGVCACITPFNFPAMVLMWMFPIAHMHSMDGVRFFTRTKTTKKHWPPAMRTDPEFTMPTLG